VALHEKMKKQTKYPSGWDEARVRRVLAHYEEQIEDEAVAEDEVAFKICTGETPVPPRQKDKK
jgi:hypothetical protein